MLRYRRIWSLLMAACLLLVSACSGAQQLGSQSGDSGGKAEVAKSGKPQVIGYAIQDDPGSLDPLKVTQLTTYQVLQFLTDRLLSLDQNKKPVPAVAESWDVQEEGKVIIFKIRSGLKFTDGTPLDAEAVAFNFNRHLDPANKSMQRVQLGPLNKVEAVGADRVKFTFAQPFAPIYTNLASAFLGLFSPTAIKQEPEGFGLKPVASGPFMLKEWKRASELILVRNPNYVNTYYGVTNQGPPTIAELHIKIIPEEGTRTAALETGEVHFGGAPLEELARFKDNKQFRLDIQKEQNNFSFVEMNPFKAPTDDIRVRKAIAQAINRDEVTLGAYSGIATPNGLPFPNGILGYDKGLADRIGYRYDLAAAKQLLEEAGYTMGSNGIYQKAGKPLQLVMYTYTLPSGTKAAQVIMQNLKAAGIDVKLESQEVAANLAKLKERQHNINWMWYAWSDPVILSLIFKGPGWHGVYSNPDLDRLLTAADSEMDPARRADKVRAALEFLLNDAAVVPICTNWAVYLSRAEVEGLKYDAGGLPLLNDVVVK